MITFYMVKRIIRSILAVSLAAWLIFLLIPRTNHYQYDCMLNAKYESAQIDELYGGTVHVTTDLQTKTIFDKIYISGEITVQNKKYTVSKKQFVPRSVFARIKTYFEYGGTMKPDFNSLSFYMDFLEPELKEYNMHMDISLTYNRISLYVHKVEESTTTLSTYSGYFK